MRLKIYLLEWIKYRKQPLFYILWGLFAIVLYVVVSSIFNENLSFGVVRQQINSFKETPGLYKLTGYIANWLLYFVMGYWTVYIISSEYQQKTLRQSIITGLKRIEFFLLKMSHIKIIAAWAAFIIGLINIIFIISFKSDFRFGDWLFWWFDLYLLGILYGLLAALIAIWIRRSGLAYIIYLSFFLISRIFVNLLKRVFGESVSEFKYWPHRIYEHLTPDVFERYKKIVDPNNALFSGQTSLMETFVSAILLSFILGILLYSSIKTKDI